MAFNNSVPVKLNVSHDSGTNLITFTLTTYAFNVSTGLYDIQQGAAEVIEIPANVCSHNEVIGKVVTVQNNSQDEFEISTGWYDVVNDVHYPNAGQTLVDLIDTYIAMSTGGGSTTLWVALSETAAKAAYGTAGLVAGVSYMITLDGTSQGNNGDVIYTRCTEMGVLSGQMDYVPNATGDLLQVQGLFNGSGFTLLRADQAKTYTYNYDSSLDTAIDLSAVRMYGIIDLIDSNTGGSSIDSIAGNLAGDIVTLKSSDTSAKIDVNGSALFYNNGFVGVLSFAADDFITIQKHIIDSEYNVINAFGSYTGGPREYVALLTQSGTDAPTPTVIKNTIGAITFSYDDTATYIIGSNAMFTENKTTWSIPRQTSGADMYKITWSDSSNLLLSATADDTLTSTVSCLEIKVWP